MLNPDKSALRRAMAEDPLKARRDYAGPALFSYGFRPFFLFGAVWAAIAAPTWIAVYAAGGAEIGGMPALAWHVHEMLFGFIAAVLAGFLLTAVPNWTGRLPVRGRGLGVLFAIWAAGRLAMLGYGPLGVGAAMVDSAFLLVLAGLLWREVLTGGNAKNIPVCALTSVLALANLGFHAALASGASLRPYEALAVAAVALLIALIGGRIVPSFTRNWLAQRGEARLPAQTGRFDMLALFAAGAALAAWLVAPYQAATGGLLLLAGALHAVRLARWKGWRTGAEPLVLVLHAGYAWLPLALLLMGAGVFAPGIVPASAALHALTAGAMGTMTLAVMTRASLGHTGRAREADRWTSAIFVLVVAGALTRVAGPVAAAALSTGSATIALAASVVLWSGAFALFAARYAPILTRPRVC